MQITEPTAHKAGRKEIKGGGGGPVSYSPVVSLAFICSSACGAKTYRVLVTVSGFLWTHMEGAIDFE